jgi:ABC-type branched-subunit amino acid transport system permease subunit
LKKSEATNPVLDYSRLPVSLSPRQQAIRANAGVAVAVILFILLGRFVITRGIVGPYNLEIIMQVGVAIILAVSLQLINGFSGQFSLGHAGFMAIGAYLAGYPSVSYSSGMTDPGAVALFYLSLGLCISIAGALLLMLFLLARWSGRIHSALPGVLMVLIFAWIAIDVSQAANVPGEPPAYLVFSKSVSLLMRLYETMMSSGFPLAHGISTLLPPAMRGPIAFLVLLVGGGACAAAAGLIVGLPTLRLRGDYLAIATLGFAEIIRVVITTSSPLGGALGLGGITTYTNFGWLYGAVIVTIIVIWRLAYSAKGRAIMAVRDDEIAAAAVGIDTTHHKVIAFVIGAFFAGVGGALYAHYTGFITPTDFNIIRSIEFVVMVTLGGLGSISGAILAAIVLTLLPEVLRAIADWRMVIYSLLLIVMMLLRPQGLLGGRELWPKRRALGEQPA